jgi:hypothetical protein
VGFLGRELVVLGSTIVGIHPLDSACWLIHGSEGGLLYQVCRLLKRWQAIFGLNSVVSYENIVVSMKGVE